MKKILFSYRIFILVVFVYMIACSKNKGEEDQVVEQINIDSLMRIETEDTVPPIPIPSTSTAACLDGPKYEDSIIFIQPTSGTDYITGPVNNPGPGRYFSMPQGMALDPSTGAINVTKSETGLRYTIGFIKTGTNDTCIQSLILSGASYIDSIYVLNKNQTKAAPYFDGNPQSGSICADNSGPGGSRCNFIASNKKVRIENGTGIIDLEQTLEQGVFGILPLNGQSVKVSIFYRLKDKSNLALQKTDVQLVFYEKKSLIPQVLLDLVQKKGLDIVNLNLGLFAVKTNPRPPMIIITRS